jgi:hypothetical protein
MSEEQVPAATEEQPASQVPVETEETPETTTQPAGETEAEVQTDGNAEEQLLPPEIESQLTGKHLDAYKKAQKVITQKFMKLSEQRKSLEPYQEFIKAYSENPRETVQWLAEQHGINFSKSDSRSETAAKVEAATQTLTEELRQSLGPDFEFLADKIGPVVEGFAKKIADSSVGPLKAAQEQAKLESAKKQTEAVLETFTLKHPEWKKYEPKMTELSSKLSPNGLDENTYLEILYTYATRDIAEANAAKKMVARMQNAAAKSETPDGGVEPSRVAQTLSGKTFREKIHSAFDLAKQGISIEQ